MELRQAMVEPVTDGNRGSMGQVSNAGATTLAARARGGARVVAEAAERPVPGWAARRRRRRRGRRQRRRHADRARVGRGGRVGDRGRRRPRLLDEPEQPPRDEGGGRAGARRSCWPPARSAAQVPWDVTVDADAVYWSTYNSPGTVMTRAARRRHARRRWPRGRTVRATSPSSARTSTGSTSGSSAATRARC